MHEYLQMCFWTGYEIFENVHVCYLWWTCSSLQATGGSWRGTKYWCRTWLPQKRETRHGIWRECLAARSGKETEEEESKRWINNKLTNRLFMERRTLRESQKEKERDRVIEEWEDMWATSLHAHHNKTMATIVRHGNTKGFGGQLVTFGQFSADFLRQSFSTNRNETG